MSASEASQSLWKTLSPLANRAALVGSQRADVCVVGAGIAGLSVAYRLACAGRSVIVLDRQSIGGGETAQTSAHLASALDEGYAQLEKLHGTQGARLAYLSHDAAIGAIEELVAEASIDCDFERVDGFLFAGAGDSPQTLQAELAAAQRAGVAEVEYLDHSPLPRWPGPCLRFPRQAQLQPLAYLNGLAARAEQLGVRIYTGSAVTSFAGGPEVVVTTDRGQVTAAHLVVATNSPINDRFAMHSKQEPFRTFVVALQVPSATIPRALFWDTGDPYHYVRLQRMAGGDARLLVGGEDHKTGHADDADARFARLEAWARQHFDGVGAVAERWSGQCLEPFDGLAFIGRNPLDGDNVYIVSGDSGHGLTHGTIAGILISELIAGRDHPWATLYDPSRKTLRAAATYAQINASVAATFVDYVTGGDVDSVEAIAPGQGAIVRNGLGKEAVFRSHDGRISRCSAVCPHLGCLVHWNSAETSWDCPCHGSRFAPEGDVLTGPAKQGLARVK